jgi:outer membrane protein assembly factor BamB
MKIDPSLRGSLPRVSPPVPWRSKDGLRNGWKVTIPGRRPLATPALADGRVFLGGGFGSYDFYALDAATGHVLWQYQTEDDGPTAAVVHGRHVAFNTESCALEMLTVEGKPVWKKWLGDPLMSIPAMAGERIYQVYPDSRGDRRHGRRQPVRHRNRRPARRRLAHVGRQPGPQRPTLLLTVAQ